MRNEKHKLAMEPIQRQFRPHSITQTGIFLSPLLLFLGWAETRKTSGVSAAFILANSVAGLAGNLLSVKAIPQAPTNRLTAVRNRLKFLG